MSPGRYCHPLFDDFNPNGSATGPSALPNMLRSSEITMMVLVEASSS